MHLELRKGSRPSVLAVMVLLIMAAFVLRLFYLQVIRHDYYVAAANAEQLKQLVIPASRGEIYAMDGVTPVKLVMNETVYTVFADPKIITDSQPVIDAVQRVAGGNARTNLGGLLAKKESRYQILATKISTKQAEMLRAAKLVGVGFQRESQRVYPEGGLAAQSLGFVDSEGFGRYGIEGKLNQRLTGIDGTLQSVTDVRDVPLTIGNKNIHIPAKNGENVVMTIDRNVQSYAEKALADGLKRSGATHGSVMVMDPQSGKVMAMANLPTYNPGEYNKVQDAAAFNNGTISAPYEAGSVIKTLTMATGIDKGVVQPESTYVNTDSIKVEGETIRNATKGKTGRVSYQTAMNYSLNTGFVTIAQLLGNGTYITQDARQTIYNYFHDRFGLGKTTGIELSNEAEGIIRSPKEVSGGAVQYSNMVFGQGMDVTMVQVCAAFSAVINGGTYHSPTVIAGSVDGKTGAFLPAPKKATRAQVVQASTSDKVRKMVHDARKEFYGSVDRPGFYTGGKTGTSETIQGSGYVDDVTIGSYLGYGGTNSGGDGPKYVIMVRVSGKDLNLGGNTDAMPIFTDISNWMLDYMKLQPKG